MITDRHLNKINRIQNLNYINRLHNKLIYSKRLIGEY